MVSTRASIRGDRPIPATVRAGGHTQADFTDRLELQPEIETPEKPIQLPRRGRKQRVVFSVKEVKRIAQGLQSCDKELSLDEQLLRHRTCKTSKPKPPVKLPKKYELLAEFFDCMESSIQLLRSKGTTPTFSNICSSIQYLCERRFTCGHLVQLKYVLPDAILIKKVPARDEVSGCRKPELQVSLQIDAVEENTKQNGESGHSLLRKVFRERLVDFSKAHPEEDDIPASELLDETPVKHVSTPARFMTSTPEILDPKRYCSTSMVESPSIKKRAIRRKLFQTPTKSVKTEDEELEVSSPSTDNDVISFLPEALLHSIREQEKKTLMEKEAGAASAKRREKMKSSLPDIFNLIHLLFQSENRATMTKQELIDKIIKSHRKIVDRSEIEEQLKLLQEIVPDWISEKIASSGETLFCVNKICIPEEIRQRLAEAE